MKRTPHLARLAVAVLLVSTILSLTLWTPASAQIVPPNRNAVNFNAAFFSGSTNLDLGFSYGFTKNLDFTAFWGYNSSSPTGSLVDGGVRYHFALPTPGADVFVGAGIGNISGTNPGFGTVNATTISWGAGGSLKLGPTVTGYLGVGFFSFGTSQSIIDLGVQVPIGHELSGQVGWLDYAGSSALYVGLTLGLPGMSGMH